MKKLVIALVLVLGICSICLMSCGPVDNNGLDTTPDITNATPDKLPATTPDNITPDKTILPTPDITPDITLDTTVTPDITPVDPMPNR